MNLGRSFVTWPRQRTVDPAPYLRPNSFCLLDYQLLQLRFVDRRHVRKPRPKAFVVWTTQRTVAHQIQVIADHHQRALAEFDIDATRSISKNERLDAQHFEGAYGKGNFFERITFVVMDPALHCNDGNRIDFSDYQPARMTLRR